MTTTNCTTETTIVEAVTVPEAFPAAVADAIAALRAANVPEIARRIHDEITPTVSSWTGLPDELFHLVSDRTGFDELYALISDAATALNHCTTHPTIDSYPGFLTPDEIARFDEIDRHLHQMEAHTADLDDLADVPAPTA